MILVFAFVLPLLVGLFVGLILSDDGPSMSAVVMVVLAAAIAVPVGGWLLIESLPGVMRIASSDVAEIQDAFDAGRQSVR